MVYRRGERKGDDEPGPTPAKLPRPPKVGPVTSPAPGPGEAGPAIRELVERIRYHSASLCA
jgi:hypothetical protein